MAGATQLSIYNKALRHLEERKLASINENREPLRYLNDEWADAVEYCLYDGYWNFAVRLISSQAEKNISPNFGYAYCFKKPSDFVRLFQMSDNENFDPLLRNFTDQAGYWYTDITPVFVKYVSNDSQYGMNMSAWTPGFIEYLAAYLARLCAPRLKQSQDKIEGLDKVLKRARANAMSIDAMDLPPGKPPYGTWVTSRAPRGSVQPMGSPFSGNDD